VTSDPRAFLAADHGGATSGAALIGRVGHAWRLLGSVALPAAVGDAAAAALVVERFAAAAPSLATRLGIDPAHVDAIPMVRVRSAAPRTLGVVAASERALAPLTAAAARSGWRVVSASAATTDPLAMTALLLDPAVDGVLAGAGDPPGADERGAIAELTSLVAAVAARQPDRLVILAGGMADSVGAFGDASARDGETLLAPAAREGAAGAPLRELLTELAAPADDARRAIGAATASLAELLDRRIEVIEIGFDGGLRARSAPGGPGEPPSTDVAMVPAARLVPADPDDAAVDRVLGWVTTASDRHRLRDRMRELRIAPWSDATGDGMAFRLAALRAALGRLAEATPEFAAGPPPDLVIAAGGAWSTMTPASVALAINDVIRRPGATAFAIDHARLLGALGSIPDADERRAVLADMVDDLLAPIGTVVTPAGLRTGRSAGSLVLHAASAGPAVDLHPGGLQVVALPAGTSAVAEFHFRDGVRLGVRGRHFAIEVAGGLAGLMVDLRDVPLRLPDRSDRRRELLDGWQAAVSGPVAR
jgi:hypothetical protein